MSGSLEKRLRAALGEGELARRLPVAAAGFLDRRSGDAALQRAEGPVLEGLARVVASSPAVAGFLSHRPALVERLANADAGTLAGRARELGAAAEARGGEDLESALDALRLLRREETCAAACLDLGGLAPFEEVSSFLSSLAEAIVRRALALAQRSSARDGVSVVGMGKIAGREFTYHSDLDLIFLYPGDPDAMVEASRVAQRLIAYLTTMTGAGVAYSVDTRLRPSGRQGTLVTSLDAFERYQSEQAHTWEHVAVLRARVVAGETGRAREVLQRVRARLVERRSQPWPELATLRRRVESERARESRGGVALKTGPGGLMDVDYLASGGLLETGAPPPSLPSVSALLRAAVGGPRVDSLLADYRSLRVIEARARWSAGRAAEALPADPAALAAVAELVERGLDADALLARLDAVRRRVRDAYDAVIHAGSIRALGPPP